MAPCRIPELVMEQIMVAWKLYGSFAFTFQCIAKKNVGQIFWILKNFVTQNNSYRELWFSKLFWIGPLQLISNTSFISKVRLANPIAMANLASIYSKMSGTSGRTWIMNCWFLPLWFSTICFYEAFIWFLNFGGSLWGAKSQKMFKKVTHKSPAYFGIAFLRPKKMLEF